MACMATAASGIDLDQDWDAASFSEVESKVLRLLLIAKRQHGHWLTI